MHGCECGAVIKCAACCLPRNQPSDGQSAWWPARTRGGRRMAKFDVARILSHSYNKPLIYTCKRGRTVISYSLAV